MVQGLFNNFVSQLPHFCSFLTLKIYKRQSQDYFLNKNNFCIIWYWLFFRLPSLQSSQRPSPKCYFITLPTWSLFKIGPKLAGVWGPGLLCYHVGYLY